MSGTAINHPLVREYLRELDGALAALPAGRASELREQLAAHLDEALPPGASDAEVAAMLKRLGSPASLAAEAGAPIARLPTGVRVRLGRVRARTWAVVAMAIALTGFGIWALVIYLTIGNLQPGPSSGWWYGQDANRAVITTANGAAQTTVPIRDAQRQGFWFSIYNPTDWTQTVVAPAPLQGTGFQDPQVAVSVFNPTVEKGGLTPGGRFTLPGSIPPHQYRLVRLRWISTFCLAPGQQVGLPSLTLNVHVGWFTRTETIWFSTAFDLTGPGTGRCNPNGD